jgi:hypothetical protein
MKAPVEHYLLTIVLTPNLHMHGYLMCPDKRFVTHAIDQMMDVAEKEGFRPLPMGLATTLSTGVEIVRGIIREASLEAGEKLNTATDYHFSAFTMEAGDPRDQRLMELH